jgi:signal transduction histidine kinase
VDPDVSSSPEFLPQLRLDELLSELQGRLQAVLGARDQMRGLLEAVVAISSGLDLESTLRRIVETAVRLVDATYGALGVIGDDKQLAEFIPVGLTEDEIRQIHHWPEGRGLLGLLVKEPQQLRLASISAHPESSGFPAGHPAMESFLGVPVRVRDQVFGNLYLTNKRGGGEFTEDDEAVLLALGAAAGVAVENARLYEATRRSQRWIQASAEVTTELLSGTEPDEVLALITSQARELSDADLALLALPDEEGRRLTIVHADGDGAQAVRGLVLPVGQSLSGQVLSSGEPMISADFAADERAAPAARAAMSHVGAAVVFPLGARSGRRGVLTIGRRHGRAPFPAAAATFAASFAAQAAVALELAASRAEAERLSVYQDRDRIARDLHDLVIQRLYATGMSLQAMTPMISRPEVAERVSRAVDAMDQTIKEIRGAIFALQARDVEANRDPRADIVQLVEEMTAMLGFAPSLRLGPGLRTLDREELTEQTLIVLREALSNMARHAGATRADVTVDVGPDGFLTVAVTDNGTGIPPESRRSGLRNLADRAAELGGELWLSPVEPAAPRPGTRLEWRVPASAAPARRTATQALRLPGLAFLSVRSERTRTGAPGKSLAADASSVHDRRRDADEMVAFPRDP